MGQGIIPCPYFYGPFKKRQEAQMHEDRPKPLINQSTIDWLRRVFPAVPYKAGMTLDQLAYYAVHQEIIDRLARELQS